MCGVGIVSYLIGDLLQVLTIEKVYSLAALFPVLMLVLMVLRRNWIKGQSSFRTCAWAESRRLV